MVEMEAISDRNSVRYIGTITCDKIEALELAQADFCESSFENNRHHATRGACNGEVGGMEGLSIWIEMDVQTTMQTKTEIENNRHHATRGTACNGEVGGIRDSVEGLRDS